MTCPFPTGKGIEYVWTVAGLCEPVPTLMFLTSTAWERLANEVKRRQRASADGTPTPINFSELRVGCLTVVNSRSESQTAVDAANQQAARDANFAAKKAALISGRGPHDAHIEAAE